MGKWFVRFTLLGRGHSALIDPSAVVAVTSEVSGGTRIDLVTGHSYDVVGLIDEVESRLGIESDRPE